MSCQHENFDAHVNVVRLEDAGKFRAEVRIKCIQCDTPFVFEGLPCGYRRSEPTVSVDGQEANMPISPGPLEINLSQSIRFEV